MAKKNEKTELEKIEVGLIRSFAHWESLKKFGGQDPFWADGCNMNLTRDHIINYKMDLEELYRDGKIDALPEIYYRETPEKVDDNYMARASEIQENAKKSLQKYKDNEDYNYLLAIVSFLDKKQAEKISIHNVMGYVRRLELAIESDNLVNMRLHEKPERYIESFRDCRKRLDDILKDSEKEVKTESGEFLEQISVFDLLNIEESRSQNGKRNESR